MVPCTICPMGSGEMFSCGPVGFEFQVELLSVKGGLPGSPVRVSERLLLSVALTGVLCSLVNYCLSAHLRCSDAEG